MERKREEEMEIEYINKLKKGKINWRILGENFVFQQGGTFYKMPSFIGKNIFYKKSNSYIQAKENFEIIKQYFGNITSIADTEIMQNKDGHYIIKQKEIQGKILTKKDLEENYLLLSKFKKIVIVNEIFWEKEGVFLDLLGSDFLLRPKKIHNLMTDGKEIYIFDFGLFTKKPKNIYFKWLSYIATKIQMFIIAKFWDK